MSMRITSTANTIGKLAVVSTLRQTNPKTGIVHVCANCYPWYGSQFHEKISHGICKPHSDQVMKEWLAAMKPTDHPKESE